MGMGGLWDFRRRRRHGHLRTMATGGMAGMTPLMMMVLLGLWWDVHSTGFFYSEEYDEASFRATCERVATWVDDYRSVHGCLPDSIAACGMVLGFDSVRYVDTTKWDKMELFYRHDDSSYTLEHYREWIKFVSMPDFEGYVVHRWDYDLHRDIVELVPRCANN